MTGAMGVHLCCDRGVDPLICGLSDEVAIRAAIYVKGRRAFANLFLHFTFTTDYIGHYHAMLR